MLDARQQLHADVRDEYDRHDPRRHERNGDDPENPAGIFPTEELAKPIGKKASRGYESSRQHREGGGFPGERCGANAIPALLHFHHHHLDGDDGVIDQEAERDDQRAERDPVQIEPDRVHDDEDDGKDQRHRQRDDEAGAPTQREKADEQNDRQRFDEGSNKLVDRMIDDGRLIGDLLEIETLRDRFDEFVCRGGDGRTQVQDVGAFRHDDADADG